MSRSARGCADGPADIIDQRLNESTPTKRQASRRTEMRINSKDFRVKEGDEVDLEKWATIVEPVYKSEDQYQKLLESMLRS